MKRTLLITLSLLLLLNAKAQITIDQVLNEVVANNLHLKSLKQISDADKLDNSTGLYPENPEVGFNYLWGDPGLIGNRKDFSITQTFDFPSAYVHKSAISNLRNNQLDFSYRHELLKLVNETRLVCIDLVYINAAITENNRRLSNSQVVADAYKSRFNSGDANILEYNKAQLDLLNIQKQSESLQLEKERLLLELAALNSGNPIDFNNAEFQLPVIDADFEKWFKGVESNNPDLQWIQQENEIIDRQISLNSALSLPKISMGYMSENVPGEKFSGISMGVTIPLYENKNVVKSSKVRLAASQNLQKDVRLQFYLDMKSKYNTAMKLAENIDTYRSQLIRFNNSELLKKALDAGEISLLDYMLELSLYYDSLDQLLILEKEHHRAFAELMRYTF